MTGNILHEFFVYYQSDHRHPLILSVAYTLCNIELISLYLLSKWGAPMVHQTYYAKGMQESSAMYWERDLSCHRKKETASPPKKVWQH